MDGWGCLPVIGRDGDQRLDAALKVDLCRKSRSQAKETGYPASPHSPPEGIPSLGTPGLPSSFRCFFQEIPTAQPPSLGSWPHAHPHTLSPFPSPLCLLTPPGLNLVFFDFVDLDLDT